MFVSALVFSLCLGVLFFSLHFYEHVSVFVFAYDVPECSVFVCEALRGFRTVYFLCACVFMCVCVCLVWCVCVCVCVRVWPV